MRNFPCIGKDGSFLHFRKSIFDSEPYSSWRRMPCQWVFSALGWFCLICRQTPSLAPLSPQSRVGDIRCAASCESEREFLAVAAEGGRRALGNFSSIRENFDLRCKRTGGEQKKRNLSSNSSKKNLATTLRNSSTFWLIRRFISEALSLARAPNFWVMAVHA